MTTYIAGPMTGLPDFNYPAFEAAAEELRSRGVKVHCPTDNDDGSHGKPWKFYMRLALRQLLECDEIVLLPGWEGSRGARLERHVADQLGLIVTLWEDVEATAHSASIPPLCACGHRAGNPGWHAEGWYVCLVDGCRCLGFTTRKEQAA